MNILKSVGRFFAGIFILLGLTIFIMSYFGSYAVDNVGILEKDLSDNFVNLVSDPEMKSFVEECNNNPQMEGCDEINSFKEDNPVLSKIEDEISGFSYYGDMMRMFGIVFFIAGLLLFIWCNGWLNGLKAASLTTFIGVVFSYIYYKYAIMGAITGFLPPEMVSIIGNWATITINHTLNFIMVLGVIFLILTVVLYILHHKKMKGKVLGNE